MDKSFTFLVTADCNGGCQHCSTRPWMIANKGYHMLLSDVMDFVEYSRASGYVFREINLAGGEPLMWKAIFPATKRLYESGIAETINIITNGLLVNKETAPWISDLAEVATIKVSRYIGNEANVEFAQAYFPGRIQVSDGIERRVGPDHFIEGSLPADCICHGRFGFANGLVTRCSPVRSMGYLYPEQNPITIKSAWFCVPYAETDRYATRLKKNFLDHFSGVSSIDQPYCQACVANRKIHPHVETVKNEVCHGD